MCRSKRAADAANPTSTSGRQSPSSTQRTPSTPTNRQPPAFNSSGPSTSTSSNFYNNSDHSSSSGISSRASLASIRQSLPENPSLYHISEIRSATNNFLAPRYSAASSSTPCWRCSLRGKDVLVFQRKLNRPTSSPALRDMLSFVGRSHHVTIVKLLGSSISGSYIFLAYEFTPGTNLDDCLRNPNNPSFTVLSTWMSRMKIATDLANALDYIHNSTGLDTRLVHNHIKATSVIVSDPSFSARICHFGTSILCGEPVEDAEEELEADGMKFQGKMGYMAPEFQESGIGSQRSDVYAFGVVILELLSGEEAVKYKYDKGRGEYERRSVVEAARQAVEEEGRLRRWVDGRLRDSFPVEVVERVTRLGLECVQVEEYKRPNMRRVAGKISKLYLESKSWAERIQRPPDLTVSFGPR